MPSPLETAQPPSTFEPNEPSFSLRSLKIGLRPAYFSSLASSRETLLDTIQPLCAQTCRRLDVNMRRADEAPLKSAGMKAARPVSSGERARGASAARTAAAT